MSPVQRQWDYAGDPQLTAPPSASKPVRHACSARPDVKPIDLAEAFRGL